MDFLAGEGIMAAGAGELESSSTLARTVDLVKAVMVDFSLLTTALFFEELFIAKLSNSLYLHVKKNF